MQDRWRIPKQSNLGWLALALGLLGHSSPAMAQLNLSPDRSAQGDLGTQVVPANAVIDVVVNGTRPNNGPNLFHSFQELNVRAGRSVYFQALPGVKRVFSRVTGSDPSDILGVLGTFGDSASLFLINPNGILFGPGARLDIGGSFTATTANGLRLGDTGQFSAQPSSSDRLLTISPSAFFFTSSSPKPIISQANGIGFSVNSGGLTRGLQVPQGQTLTLLGGPLQINQSFLYAPDGTLQLAALEGRGEVTIETGGALTLAPGLSTADITVNRSSAVVAGAQGGNLRLIGQNVTIADRSRLIGGIDPGSGGTGRQAGDVQIQATGAIQILGRSGIENEIGVNGIGQGGSLILTGQSLQVADGSRLTASTRGRGNSGNIRITIDGPVVFQGFDPGSGFLSSAFSSVDSNAIGDAGMLSITAQSLTVLDSAQLVTGTRGRGNAGNVIVNVQEQADFLGGDAFSSVEAGAVGRGGNIEITANRMRVDGGGQLVANLRGTGVAGNVSLRVTGSIVLQGTGIDPLTGQFLAGSGLFSAVEPGGRGVGGNVAVTAGQLEVLDGAQIAATVTQAQGDAGQIVIEVGDRLLIQGTAPNNPAGRSAIANSIQRGSQGKGNDIIITAGAVEGLDGGFISSVTNGIGHAGTIHIIARDHVRFQGANPDGSLPSGAFTSVEHNGQGKGGNLQISTRSLEVLDGAEISAGTKGQGDSGNVIIEAQRTLFRRGDTFVSVEQSAQGHGGNLQITTGTLEVLEGGQLVTRTRGIGNAGNVSITASERVLMRGNARNGLLPSGVFTAVEQTAQGNGGEIQIRSPRIDLEDGAQLTSGTRGQGIAGDIRLTASDRIQVNGATMLANSFSPFAAGNVEVITPRLILDHQGQIITDADSVDGGNIRFDLGQILVMRNNSLISATAGRALGSGDGGNITIKAPFVLTVPGENNDLIANAFSGRGGNITIDADTILHFSLNDRKSFDTLRAQSSNDISASSQLGTQGVLNLRGLNVDPSQGVFELPNYLSDRSQIYNPCKPVGNQPGRAYRDRFVITGRGGIAETPFDQARSVTQDRTEWIRVPTATAPESTPLSPTATTLTPTPLLEATTWERTATGAIALVAPQPLRSPFSKTCDRRSGS